MTIIRKVLLTFMLLLPVLAAAQDDAAVYMQQAGGSALLFRGHRAHGYPQPFNGTFYWEGPGFKDGAVRYNGKHYENLQLNVDAVRQDLIVRTPSGGDGKVLEGDYVESFMMGGHQFLHLRNLYGGEAPAGYWEVLYDGRAKVLKQVVRILQKDLNGSMRSSMGYDGEYREGVHNIFVYQEKYCYMAEDGTLVPLRSRSQLMRFYKNHKREINRHISNLESSGRLSMERYCTEVVKYAEKLAEKL